MVRINGELVVLVDANVWVSRNLRDWVCALYVHSSAMCTSQPGVVRDAIRDQISYFLRRGTEPNLPTGLKRAGAPDFAERVRTMQLDMEF